MIGVVILHIPFVSVQISGHVKCEYKNRRSMDGIETWGEIIYSVYNMCMYGKLCEAVHKGNSERENELRPDNKRDRGRMRESEGRKGQGD